MVATRVQAHRNCWLSIASCTAITMEMYADRKGWDLGDLEVECEYETPQRGSPAAFTIVLRLPESCTQDQLDTLRIVASKCPVHRMLQGESVFEERIELRDARADLGRVCASNAYRSV